MENLFLLDLRGYSNTELRSALKDLCYYLSNIQGCVYSNENYLLRYFKGDFKFVNLDNLSDGINDINEKVYVTYFIDHNLFIGNILNLNLNNMKESENKVNKISWYNLNPRYLPRVNQIHIYKNIELVENKTEKLIISAKVVKINISNLEVVTLDKINILNNISNYETLVSRDAVNKKSGNVYTIVGFSIDCNNNCTDRFGLTIHYTSKDNNELLFTRSFNEFLSKFELK